MLQLELKSLPGAYTLAVMPCLPTSRAGMDILHMNSLLMVKTAQDTPTDCVKPRMANLAAQ